MMLKKTLIPVALIAGLAASSLAGCTSTTTPTPTSSASGAPKIVDGASGLPSDVPVIAQDQVASSNHYGSLDSGSYTLNLKTKTDNAKDAAVKLLTDAGYTWKDGALIDPKGAPVSFTLQDPQGWNDYVTGIQLAATQIKSTLGADAKVATPDADTWFANMASGNFDAALHWTGSGSNPWHIYDDVMNSSYLDQAADGKVSDNFGRYSNPEATALLKEYAQASDDGARTAALNKLQKIFVDDVPAIAIGTHPQLAEYNTRKFTGWPSEQNQYATADPTQPSAVQVLMNLKPAGK